MPSSASDDVLRRLIRLANVYHDKASKQKVLCTASIDEIRSAVRALSVLADQGIDDPEAAYLVIKSALVKTPECEPFFEEAFAEVIKGEKGGAT